METNQHAPFPFSFDHVFTNDPLLGPSAHIIVRFCSKDEDGTTYLIPECKTPEELHHQINRLQSELEIIRNRAMREFVDAINGYKRKPRKKK
jgi:hypothetical protein